MHMEKLKIPWRIRSQKSQQCNHWLFSRKAQGEVIRNNVCYLKQAEAGCIGIEVMWYFDSEKNVCMEYSKGMCGSTANSFYSCEECLQKCLTSACASRIPTLWERLFGRG
ncbi:kunitz-type serine protease inhibitor vestiginin-4-like isoform X2 [Dermacentor variabilis]|uniref:kunitz-type serine protease inhibitor vestiginin-4-like isoform X2 n=1 Tax=Dermacentor variabilis TaxID=34621 RepID=UPI003F5BE024